MSKHKPNRTESPSPGPAPHVEVPSDAGCDAIQAECEKMLDAFDAAIPAPPDADEPEEEPEVAVPPKPVPRAAALWGDVSVRQTGAKS